ncbi:MAG: tRNA pseudouridine(55) synthase TruB [Syntrophales bacterium]|nr:tRNA pseudouridine(55) synthase TruB [Syntrophales bacterium]
MSGQEVLDFRCKGKPVMNGVVVVDKPAGQTSFGVIRDVRKILGIRKIGHTGTLDPLATGVLPLCINEATKMAPFLTEDDKEYRATMLLGVTTDTLDITGNIVATENPGHITDSDLESVSREFLGTMEQKVPRYSAAKHRGRPHHRWAREGVVLDTPLKRVTIENIEIESFSPPYATLLVACSKGTYIRTLCDDMGKRLGCGAALAGLRRTRSGRFSEEDALRLDDMEYGEAPRLIRNSLVPLEDVLDRYPAIPISRDLALRIREGCQPEAGALNKTTFPPAAEGTLIRLIGNDSRIVAVARMLLSSESLRTAGEKEQAMKLVRVFNV